MEKNRNLDPRLSAKTTKEHESKPSSGGGLHADAY